MDMTVQMPTMRSLVKQRTNYRNIIRIISFKSLVRVSLPRHDPPMHGLPSAHLELRGFAHGKMGRKGKTCKK